MSEKNLKEKAALGLYELIEPLDYIILSHLPEEGTLFAGLYPLGETVANIAKKLPNGPEGKSLPSSMIQTRLRVMREQSLVSKQSSIPGAGGKSIWQRTRSASEVFNKWKESTSGKRQ